jgi:3-dehydroquinate synthase|tara:strand:- start:1977 stop:3083 length:1107 start_codon:yes stop_codon:yes gene_type:complete
MKINYKVNKINYMATFCVNKESPDIYRALSKLYCDKKLLLIIDKKLNKKFTKFLFKDLKKCGLKVTLLRVNGAKINKNEKLLFQIIDKLIEKKFSKKSVLLSCGGGVIGDVSALAASLYLRGLIYFHIPTTMTAIVDSCLGGKTGINYRNIINSIGNYYHPQNIFISKNVIEQIPDREFLSGIPEIIKCGLIDNKRILASLKLNKENCLNREYNYLSKIIKSTLQTKIKFFKNDVYEQSKRLNLNFGHTFAHAIEMSFKNKNKDLIRHGEAVGIGILCEIYYTEGKSKNFKLVKNLLHKFNLPTNLSEIEVLKNKDRLKKDIFKNIFLDKKKIGKYPRIIKLVKIGESKVIEMKNNIKILDTIEKVVI